MNIPNKYIGIMKHLKRFNESNIEHFNPLIDSIKDVLVDITDIGFDVYLLKDPNGSYTDPSILNRPLGGRDNSVNNDKLLIEAIRVYIEHNPPEYSSVVFKYKDIKNSINHLIGYMKQEFGYNDFVYRDKYTEFNHLIGDQWIPNKLPVDDEEDVAVIDMMFYKSCDNKVNESITDTIENSMKYLTTYKLFEWKSLEEMNSDINDIKVMFGDVIDGGYDVVVEHEGIFDNSTISISIEEPDYSLISNIGRNQHQLTWGSIKSNVYQVLESMDDKYQFIKIEMIGYNSEETFLYSIEELKEADGTIFKDKIPPFYFIKIYLSLNETSNHI